LAPVGVVELNAGDVWIFFNSPKCRSLTTSAAAILAGSPMSL
jgi:hypothetical protein